MSGRTFTKVGAVLCAAHRDREGRMHGHTWTVWATFAVLTDTADATDLQADLRSALAFWDHDVLPEPLSTGEALAEWVGAQLPGCVRVDVERPAELIAACWEARP